MRPDVSKLVERAGNAAQSKPEGLLAAVFRAAGGPMPFDLLVRTVAECRGVTDHPEGVDVGSLTLADQAPSPDARLEREHRMARQPAASPCD